MLLLKPKCFFLFIMKRRGINCLDKNVKKALKTHVYYSGEDPRKINHRIRVLDPTFT